MDRFLISDESVNHHRFRVLIAGIDTGRFEKNPVVLWMHQRGSEVLPIGRMNELKKENGQLTGLPEFDQDDELAKKIERKVEKGYINGVSMKIEILEVSNDPSLMQDGQYLETVTRCELLEVSFVDYPSNKNSVRLCHKGQEVTIDENTVSLGANLQVNSLTQKNDNHMKKVIVALGLDDNSTEEMIVAAIKAKELAVQELNTKYAALEKEVAEGKQTRALALVEEAITAKKILGEKKEAFVKMALADYDSVKSMLDGIAPVQSLAGQANQTTPPAGGASITDPKDFAELTALGVDEYEKFKTDSPEKYRKLYHARYGKYPV